MKKKLKKYQIGTTGNQLDPVFDNSLWDLPEFSQNYNWDNSSIPGLAKFLKRRGLGNKPAGQEVGTTSVHNTDMGEYAIAQGFNLDPDGKYRKAIVTEDKNKQQFSPAFQDFNALLDLTQVVGGAVNDAKTDREERERLLKARYMQPQYNNYEKGVNNVPVYLQKGGSVNTTGYLKDAPTKHNDFNIIPSRHITTANMAFPIEANGVKLFPNTGDYLFDNDFVVEKPLKYQAGGRSPIYTNNPNDPRLRAYNDSLSIYNHAQNMLINEKAINNPLLNTQQASKALLRHWNLSGMTEGDAKTHLEIGIATQNMPIGYRVTGTGYVRPQFKKPVQPVVYQKPQPKLSNSVFDGAGYNKKYPPHYVTDPKDPRIGKYDEARPQRLYKKPLEPQEPKFKPVVNPRFQSPDVSVGVPGNVPAPNVQQAKWDNTKPSPYVYTSATGKYLEGENTYFPTEAALRAFANDQNTTSIQTTNKGATATGYIRKYQVGGTKAYNPSLAATDTAFQDWYSKNTIEGQNKIPYSEKLDYDYFSFFKNNGVGSIVNHFPDTYKRPNHSTFSNESIYATPEHPGGKWKRGKFISPMQAGGEVGQVKAFYDSYINSDKYKQRLNTQGIENIDEIKNTRLETIKKIREVTSTDGSRMDGNQIRYDSNQTKKLNLSKDDVLAHEISHGFGASRIDSNPLLNLNSSEMENIKKWRTKGNTYYNQKPHEAKADIDAFRYMLWKDKIYDTRSQFFDKKTLDKAAEKYKDNFLFKRLSSGLSEEGIIDIMNNIAKNNMQGLFHAQNGGEVEQVEGVPKYQANGMLEQGEVFLNNSGDIQKVAETEDRHEAASGGSPQANVQRVLEDTGDKRNDKMSKILLITPKEAKEFIDFKPKRSVTHSKLFELVTEDDQKKFDRFQKKLDKNLDYINMNGGLFAKNALEENLKLIEQFPTKGERFNQIYDHQEAVKQAYAMEQTGNKYQIGGSAYPSAFKNYYDKKKKEQFNAPDWITPSNFYGTPGLVDYMKGLNDMRGIDNDMNKADDSVWGWRHKAALDKFFPNGKPVIPVTTTQQSVAVTPPTVEPGIAENRKYQIPESVKASTVNEGLGWSGGYGNLLGYIGSFGRTPVEFEQLDKPQLRVHEEDVTPVINANTGDYNAAVETLPNNGVGYSNQANLQGQKYRFNNQAVAAVETRNKAKYDAVDAAQANSDIQIDQANLGLREQAKNQILLGKEKQRLQKFEFLNGIFQAIDNKNAFNRNANTALQLTPFFDANGNFNSNRYSIKANYSNNGDQQVKYIVDKETGQQFRVIYDAAGKPISSTKIIADNKGSQNYNIPLK